MPSEAAVERRCRDIAKSEGHILLKVHHTHAGFPDRMLLVRGGVVAFVEFKAAKGRLTPIQVHWAETLAGLGFRYAVVRTVQDFRALLTEATGDVILASRTL
jgi:hypothetical protein